MTRQEFWQFAAAIRTYYSRENILPNEQAMELWFRQLQDIPFPVAEAILAKWVATNKWSPSIADIRDSMAEIQNGGPADDWGEAWDQAMTAIRRFGSYDEEGALASLPPLTGRPSDGLATNRSAGARTRWRTGQTSGRCMKSCPSGRSKRIKSRYPSGKHCKPSRQVLQSR